MPVIVTPNPVVERGTAETFIINLMPVYVAPAELPNVDFAYIVDKDGWKLYKQDDVVEALVDIKLSELPTPCKPFIKLKAKKLSYLLIQQVTVWCTEVYGLRKSECAGHLYYNVAGRAWDFRVPPQTGSGAHCQYGEAEPHRNGWALAGTIHSHGSMSAFHSGTDKHDEANWAGAHITIGKVNTPTPEYAVSLVSNGSRATCKLSDVVEMPEQELVTFPQEWIDAVKEAPPVVTLSKAPAIKSLVNGQDDFTLEDWRDWEHFQNTGYRRTWR